LSPTDWLFASRCSPPRLAATQLRSATYLMRSYEVDFHHSDDVRSQAHWAEAACLRVFPHRACPGKLPGPTLSALRSSQRGFAVCSPSIDCAVRTCFGDAELTHLVKYDGEEFMDCGIMRAKIPKTWIIHRANALITGIDGEPFIGEYDDISHLMIYCPPIGKKK